VAAGLDVWELLGDPAGGRGAGEGTELAVEVGLIGVAATSARSRQPPRTPAPIRATAWVKRIVRAASFGVSPNSVANSVESRRRLRKTRAARSSILIRPRVRVMSRQASTISGSTPAA
jgi:hypothetical protein